MNDVFSLWAFGNILFCFFANLTLGKLKIVRRMILKKELVGNGLTRTEYEGIIVGIWWSVAKEFKGKRWVGDWGQLAIEEGIGICDNVVVAYWHGGTGN